MSMELTVDEANFTEIKSISAEYDDLIILNEHGAAVDEQAFIEHWRSVKGTEHIKYLTIGYNSTLRNVHVIQFFPNLKALVLNGKKLLSIEGIEWYQQGGVIDINTNGNRRRDLAGLNQASIKTIYLYVERADDLSAINGCTKVTHLDLYRSPELNLLEWGQVPLESLYLKRCKFKELDNTAAISTLKDIRVLDCRNLERFTGDHSRITYLIIDNCKKLDLCTLSTFKSAYAITVNSCPLEMNLIEIGKLEKVKHITFIRCNVEVDLINLKEYFPNLESLHISKIKKDYGLKLKELNPDIEISSDSFRSEVTT
ncbi:hypothetical protein EBB07_14695 [Paenibacillaceae bacterium]|nr:hypothetical protein EBB07_14695 [Paenibacillaceae bacterium]